MSIDGISISGYMYAEVGDNKKKNDSIVLNSSDLDDNNIYSESIKKSTLLSAYTEAVCLIRKIRPVL